MSTISLRLSQSLHRRVRDLAKQEEISINQFIATALAEKL
jgi:predicted HicB family RNase H-like nuclease